MSDPHRKSDADSSSSIDVKNEWDADSCSSIVVKKEWNADSCSSVEVNLDSLFGRYQDPMADGLHRTWYPNGQLAHEYEQKSGLKVGEFRQWHDNGVLATVFPYVAGRLHGVVRQWDKDGKLLAEYTMSEGYKSEWHRLFHQRFYEWPFRDFQREIAQDFPFVRRIAGLNLRFLAIMKSLSLEEQQQLASTFVNASTFTSKNKVGMDTEFPTRRTPEDYRRLKWYGERARIQLREEWEANNPERYATYIRKYRELMRAVRDELMLVFPGKPPKPSKEELHFHATVQGFDIETVVYSGHSTWQLCYCHRLRYPPRGLDVNEICLNTWLGIPGQTYWRRITKDTIPAAAKTVGDLCRHFIGGADHFLAGLADGSLGGNET